MSANLSSHSCQFTEKTKLVEFLDGAAAGPVLLGGNSEYTREFYGLEIPRSGLPAIKIGICSYGIGIKPEWLMWKGVFLVGYNERVAFFDSNTFTLLKEIELLTLFWEFIQTPSLPHICVLCETAVVAVSPEAAMLWRCDTDLVSDFQRSENMLTLQFADHPPITLDLLTGKTMV